MSAKNGKAADAEPYQERAALIRELRERVGDQLHDLVVERDSLGSQDELVGAVRAVGAASKRVVEARGRQRQAAELGLSVSPAVRDEHEALEGLRTAVMTLGAACGAWVIDIDFDARKVGSAGW